MGDYYMGLDLGTGSLGWAVTNPQYEILRVHGKDLWGVRLFETANTAEERRLFRTGRRRLDRRNRRLELLQELFSEAVCQVDPGFFRRLKESRYVAEDKRDLSGACPALPYALFVDETYTDKEFHQEFPTIYHLRKCVMETEKPMDVRLVYLALHHILKHRGHFLFPGNNLDSIKTFRPIMERFMQAMQDEELNFCIALDEGGFALTEAVLRDKSRTKSDKKQALIKGLRAQTKCEKAVLTLIAGGAAKLSDLFSDEELKNCERAQISFSDAGYEDYAAELEELLADRYPILAYAKAVYDWALLSDVLGEATCISDAKIAVYEKHKQDLSFLKRFVKNYFSKEVYKEVFVQSREKLDNYSAYVGMVKKNGKKRPSGYVCSREAFCAYIKKRIAEHAPASDELDFLLDELEKNTFMPKQITRDNGVLPYQLHLYELRKILQSAGKYLPFLAENAGKIEQLFTFRIPYYVGPLGMQKGGSPYGWAVRKTSGAVYPWNFEEVIDVEQSAERFIRKMTNKCTYLIGEDVLPKESLLYSRFMVLNELNNLRIDGSPITVELKQRLYYDLFERYRKVTKRRLCDYLKKEGITKSQPDITGIDDNFQTSLKSYHDLKEKLTGCALSQDDREQIILNLTLFSDDKKLLKKRLSHMFPSLTEGQLKGILSLHYAGWGRLSRAFLEEIQAPNPETGEAWSILRALWETNDNLMQLLSKKYQFANAVEERNSDHEPAEFSYDTVEQLYVSPAVKRQIWQTMLVVKELCKVMGKPPKRVFLEMAREKQESRRTVSRKQTLLELYRHCREEERDWKAELEITEDHQFKSDRLYLYYTQKGRCMYSGEPIELSSLWDQNRYDIDHIYPQSKVMDDSLDNRVLVKKTYNAAKTDEYPLKQEIRSRQKPFWNILLEAGLISKEKYKRLIRSTEFEEVELAGFIQRQIVETRQSTKAVANILKQALPDTEIVYVKAPNVSQFRQDFKFIKVRDMNDYHHAKDAYLNIVVGNCYFTKFTQNAAWFIAHNPGRSYNLKRMFTSNQNIERNGESAWRAGEGGTITTVRRMMNRNSILFTRRSAEGTGGLFDQQLMKKGKGQVPIKGSDQRLLDIGKYGGYNKAKGAYFMLVESLDKKGKPTRTIEVVPIYLKAKLEADQNAIMQYCCENLGLREPKILLPKIKIDTLFKLDGFYMHLSGRTGGQLLFKGANQLVLSSKQEKVLKCIGKYVESAKKVKNLKLTAYDGIERSELLELYDTFLDKLRNTVYGVRLGTQEVTLTKQRECFEQLCMEEQCQVLSEILHLFQCQSGAANLKLIGGPAKAGILVLNNDITKCKQISIIHQSPTGIFEQENDLLHL